MAGNVRGVCHLCKDSGEVEFCSLCGHYFDAKCRARWWARGIEFVKQIVGGKYDGCCGPREVSHAGSERASA